MNTSHSDGDGESEDDNLLDLTEYPQSPPSSPIEPGQRARPGAVVFPDDHDLIPGHGW